MKEKTYTGTPFSNDPKLHDEIGNICTDPQKLAERSFENGEAFYKASVFLLPVQSSMLIPVFTNLSFACELYLKSILYHFVKNDNNVRGHKLFDLYKQLPEDVRSEIKANTKFEHEKDDNFELFFEEVSSTFVFIRYIHERNRYCLSLDLFCLANSIRASALKLYNEQRRKENELIHSEWERYKEKNKEQELVCWIGYRGEYKESIHDVTDLIIRRMDSSLRGDFKSVECPLTKESSDNLAIKMTFSRENYWNGEEYGNFTQLSSAILKEKGFSYSGFRTTGRTFSLQKELV